MTNEQKAAEILGCTQKDCDKCDFHNQSCFEYKHLIEMAKHKDKQPISKLGGWHTEPPTEDGSVLLERNSKHEPYVVAGWSSYDKCFYDSNEQKYTKWERWKKI